MDSVAYQRLFSPQTVAAVGASPDVTRFGGRLLRSFDVNGYAGKVYPVNPRYEEIGGRRCYPSVAAIDDRVDLAILTVGNEYVVPTLEDCAAKNVRLAVLFGAGYAETGSAGAIAQEELTTIAQRSGLRILGPNCVGFVNVPDRVPATPAGAVNPPRLRQGGLSVVSQSGLVATETIYSRGHEAGLGFRYVITTGNEADLDASELMWWLAHDEQTTVIVGYIEAIRHPTRFRCAAAAARAAGKPIVLLKAGRTTDGARSARSHTAALAVSDAVFDAVCEAEAIMRVSNVDELWEVGGMLAAGVRVARPRVGVLGTSGGINTILSDDLSAVGLDLPKLQESTTNRLAEILPWFGSTENPVNLTGYFHGTGQYHLFPELAHVLASDAGIDAVIFAVQADQPKPWEELIPGLVASLKAADKPVIVLSGGGPSARKALAGIMEAGIPVYWSPERCARGLALVAGYSANLMRAHSSTSPQPSEAVRPAPARAAAISSLADAVPRWRGEHALLQAYGIATVATMEVATEQEACASAARLGFPIVMKGLAPGIAHKSDLGLVRVGLASEEQVGGAFRDIATHLGDDVTSVVVQRMITGGIELIVGSHTDPTFGPVVVVGAGGVNAELFDDRRLAMAPVSKEAARRMLASLRVARLMDGFRGGARHDIDAAADLVVEVSELAADLGESASGIDLNPVMVLPAGDGVTVVDWVIHAATALSADVV